MFDGFRKALAANRAQFYLDVASGPFYGFNRDGAEISQGTIQNWWRQGMIGSAKAHYEGIKAFSETDQTEDLKSITLPVLVMQGDDDQVVPYKKCGHPAGQAAAEQPAENLSWLPARDAHLPTPIPSTPICWRLSAPDLPSLPGRVPLMAFRQRPGRQSPGARRLTCRGNLLNSWVPDDYFPLAG
ncbi:putative non-heme chloroperoxidase [Klebsiella pneumoniae]|uniref:Putative non-heme chloroperoxidase n=1 Tax=Klebsiella pneumoniae TaxID=573 RepID=A0A377V7S5_KLEPN|nr:putative non-heme chloroperoxidase [Klebsiella pneumoniae]